MRARDVMELCAAPVMCIILGPLEPYAIIGLILLHYGAAAAEVALSDVVELKTAFEFERKNLAKCRSAHLALVEPWHTYEEWVTRPEWCTVGESSS